MKFIQGDIRDTELKFIAHGCNAQGVMGSGVAKALRDRWPGIFPGYERFCKNADNTRDLLGQYIATRDGTGPWVINLITQNRYGYDGKKYASYTAIVDSLTDFIKHWYDYEGHRRYPNPDSIIRVDENRIAIPRIGSERGGLKWEVVEELLLELEERHDVEFWVYTI